MEAIKEAIRQLPEPERRALADWMEELEEQAWDAEMERDFSPAGRGYHLVEKADCDIDDGRFTPLEDGLRARRK